eukprot:TRINITY_DN6129_c0_g1_i1.p1 TRINITY_DN6129_c0_g1~~TRINITY_DN6129_c0_g1_i1.p1  ORF type:complete len:454 (+),score=86.18 TRINITY_DN6129_c0_g1_i1:63-1424(+)
MPILGKKKSTAEWERLADFLVAAENGNLAKIQKMLKDSPSFIHAQDAEMKTGLQLATLNGHFSVVQYLLQQGSDYNTQDKSGWMSLHAAAYARNHDIFLLLLEKPEIKVGTENADKNTPLHYMARTPFDSDNLHILDILIRKGANINAQNNNGETPLHLACWKGRTEFVSLLISRKADVNLQNDHGETPLHWAARIAIKEMVDVLLAAGADPDVKGTDGSPLDVIEKLPPNSASIKDAIKDSLEKAKMERELDQTKMPAHMKGYLEKPTTSFKRRSSMHSRLSLQMSPLFQQASVSTMEESSPGSESPVNMSPDYLRRSESNLSRGESDVALRELGANGKSQSTESFNKDVSKLKRRGSRKLNPFGEITRSDVSSMEVLLFDQLSSMFGLEVEESSSSDAEVPAPSSPSVQKTPNLDKKKKIPIWAKLKSTFSLQEEKDSDLGQVEIDILIAR